MELYDPPGVRTAHGASRHKRDRYGDRRPRRPFLRSTRAPFAQIVVVLVALVLVGRLAWQGVKYLQRPRPGTSSSGVSPGTSSNGASPAPDAYQGASPAPNSSSAPSPGANTYPGTIPVPSAPDPWLFDIMSSIDEAQRDAASGNLSQSEVAIDRAGVVLTTMRLESRNAPPEFFATTIEKLDQLLRAHPDDARLLDHVTDTRTDLADLRSSLVAAPALPADVKRIVSGGPRTVARQGTLNPAALGADYLDATPMPDTMEMLTVPSARLFTDEVRVENLTMAGAAQTLDGVHWRNVTFIGTHLRYEGGELDLQNVYFVKCRFGVSSDERGARFVTAVALGQTTIVIE